jgi:hypothetical protein
MWFCAHGRHRRRLYRRRPHLALVIDDEAELRQGAFRLPVSSETSYHSHENKSRAERRGK